ncbi:MAG: T9SS type A sorting domain-containing protein [Bacteroidota bacterium]
MKEKFLLTYFFFGCFSFLHGQKSILTFVPTTADTSIQIDALSAFQSVRIQGYIENHSNKTLRVRWERNPIDVPAAWTMQVHDINNNYADFVDSNIDSDIYLNEPIVIPPKSKSILEIFFSPNGQAGKAILDIELYLAESPEVIISSQEITVEAKNKVNSHQRKSSVYPNPSGNFLQLANTQNVKRMVVYNMVGRAVKDFEVKQGVDYDIGNLPNGIYLVGLFDQKGNIIKTVRVSKRGVRP